MYVPPYSSYTDDELMRYALEGIDHPAVKELCNRVRPLGNELDELSGSDLQEEVDQANSLVDELREEIETLKEEISGFLHEIENLKDTIEDLEVQQAEADC